MKKCGGFVCKIVLCECKTCSNHRLCFFAQLRCLSMCSPSKNVFMFVCVHGTICFGESEIALLLFQSFWVTKRVTDFLRNLIVKQVVVPSRHVCGVHIAEFLRKRSCACLFQEDFARRKCIDSIRGERTEMHSFRVVAKHNCDLKTQLAI